MPTVGTAALNCFLMLSANPMLAITPTGLCPVCGCDPHPIDGLALRIVGRGGMHVDVRRPQEMNNSPKAPRVARQWQPNGKHVSRIAPDSPTGAICSCEGYGGSRVSPFGSVSSNGQPRLQQAPALDAAQRGSIGHAVLSHAET